jgi:hypothetical protein
MGEDAIAFFSNIRREGTVGCAHLYRSRLYVHVALTAASQNVNVSQYYIMIKFVAMTHSWSFQKTEKMMSSKILEKIDAKRAKMAILGSDPCHTPSTNDERAYREQSISRNYKREVLRTSTPVAVVFVLLDPFNRQCPA